MANPFDAPQTPGGPVYHQGHGEGDATGGIIPYKNPHALWAYYLGFLSLLCCFVGLPVGIAPIVLGIMGLRRRAQNPVIKGSAHAVIGIVLGSIAVLGSIFFGLAWLGVAMSAK
jgi:hypothetical protein